MGCGDGGGGDAGNNRREFEVKKEKLAGRREIEPAPSSMESTLK